MAGRSTPGRTPSTYMPMAMAAPVLPAETRAWHSPFLHSSAATRREESCLRRSALDGGLVTDEHGRESELAGRRHCALDDDGGAEVSAHGIHRDLHRPRTARPGVTRPRLRELPAPCRNRTWDRSGG